MKMEELIWTTTPVALLAEGVDRNVKIADRCLQRSVALLAEGVDRNMNGSYLIISDELSPSSRRAWIEMTTCRSLLLP